MRLDNERESDNVEDRRGESAGGGLGGMRGGAFGMRPCRRFGHRR